MRGAGPNRTGELEARCNFLAFPPRLFALKCSTPHHIPDVPTVAEAGYPALTIDGLVGLFGPPTMPIHLRERIAADIKAVMAADPLINDRLITTAQIPNPGGPAEFAKSIDEQRAILSKAAKDLGITAK